MKFKKNNPTTEETKAAIEAQAPLTIEAESKRVEDDRALTQETRYASFRQLAKVSRSAKVFFGQSQGFVKAESLFNSAYRFGDESTPFFITHAFTFESKAGYGTRLGLTIALLNGSVHSVSLPLSEGDLKRNELLAEFSRDVKPTPIGPVCFRKLPLNKGNDYYDIVPFESQSQAVSTEIEIPFPNEDDSDIPF